MGTITQREGHTILISHSKGSLTIPSEVTYEYSCVLLSIQDFVSMFLLMLVLLCINVVWEFLDKICAIRIIVMVYWLDINVNWNKVTDMEILGKMSGI